MQISLNLTSGLNLNTKGLCTFLLRTAPPISLKQRSKKNIFQNLLQGLWFEILTLDLSLKSLLGKHVACTFPPMSPSNTRAYRPESQNTGLKHNTCLHPGPKIQTFYSRGLTANKTKVRDQIESLISKVATLASTLWNKKLGFAV